jgi:hypothetical protein
MVLVKSRVGARPIVSKTMISEVFRKTNNKMVAIIMDKNREAENILERRIVMVHMEKDKDKKAKWDNTSNKTSIIVESRESHDSSLLLNKYESINSEEEKR